MWRWRPVAVGCQSSPLLANNQNCHQLRSGGRAARGPGRALAPAIPEQGQPRRAGSLSGGGLPVGQPRGHLVAVAISKRRARSRKQATADVHKNLIDGEGVVGATTTLSRDHSNVDDVIGDHAQADAAQAVEAVSAVRSAFPAWSSSNSRSAPTCWTRSAARSWRTRTGSDGCCRQRRARPLPKGSARWCAQVTFSGISPAWRCAAAVRACLRCARESK